MKEGMFRCWTRQGRGFFPPPWLWGAAALLCPLPASAQSPGAKAYQQQDYEKAESYFSRQAVKNPGDYRLQDDLGNSLYQLGKYGEASQAFEKSVSDKKDFEYGWYNLGTAYARQDRYQDAVDAYEQALKLDPKDEEARRNLEIVRKKMAQNPKKDKSRNGGKPPEKGNSPGPTPTPTPGSQNGKENEKSRKGTQGSKADQKSPSPDRDHSQAGPQGGKKQEGGTPRQDQAGAERQQEARRREQAQKALGMTPEQVKNLMAQLQKQEEETQQYYSAHPGKDQPGGGMWNFLPKDQQQFMQQFFGKPQKGNQVPEDW